MVSANYESYKSVMKQAYRDGKITDEESAILDTLRQSLNISSDEHHQIETEVQNELANGGGQNSNSNNSMSAPPPTPPPSDSNQSPNGNDDYNIIRPGMNSGDLSPSEGAAGQEPLGDMSRESSEGLQPPSPDSGEPESLEELLKAGKASYHKNDFQMAIMYFDKALQLDGENSEALFFRKRSQSKLNEAGGGMGGGATAGAGVGISNPTSASANAMMQGTAVSDTPSPGGEITGGDPNCSSCNGAGTCRWCKSGGGCYWCKGTGQCDKCKGTGILKGQQCTACAGSGKCHSCKGTGKCYWCQGSGKCSKCNM